MTLTWPPGDMSLTPCFRETLQCLLIIIIIIIIIIIHYISIALYKILKDALQHIVKIS